MTKLIVNTGTLSAGGAERVLSILSKPFADTFDEVHYVMWLDSKNPEIFYEIDPRIKIVKLSQMSGSNNLWKQILWYRKYVKREKPDLVLSFMVMICFTVSISLMFTGIKQIVAERNDPRFFSNKWLRKIINMTYHLPDIKGILMQTEWNRQYFKKSLFKKTSVIHNPINLDKNNVGIATEIPKDNIIVSVGRLEKQKQQSILIEAFALFLESHQDYKLIIYGDGSRRGNLNKLIEELGIENNVYLPGRTKDVIDKIKNAKLYVTVSEYEGMSNALIEAMCVGLPCISTKVSGATDLIVSGENGILLDSVHIDEIASKMSQLIDNPSLALQIAKEASKIYYKLNTTEIAKQWIEYLKDKY